MALDTCVFVAIGLWHWTRVFSWRVSCGTGHVFSWRVSCGTGHVCFRGECPVALGRMRLQHVVWRRPVEGAVTRWRCERSLLPDRSQLKTA